MAWQLPACVSRLAMPVLACNLETIRSGNRCAVDQVTSHCLRPWQESTLLSCSTPCCRSAGSLAIFATLCQLATQSCWARAGAGHTEDAWRAGGDSILQVTRGLQCSNARLSSLTLKTTGASVKRTICRCFEFLKRAR